jgi:hypothetical protein
MVGKAFSIKMAILAAQRLIDKELTKDAEEVCAGGRYFGSRVTL